MAACGLQASHVPSLSPSPAARGGAAVREGPAGRQLPGEVCATKRGARVTKRGARPSSASPVREKEPCASPGPVRYRAAPCRCPQPRSRSVGWPQRGGDGFGSRKQKLSAERCPRLLGPGAAVPAHPGRGWGGMQGERAGEEGCVRVRLANRKHSDLTDILVLS